MEERQIWNEPCCYKISMAIYEMGVNIPVTCYRSKFGQIRKKKDCTKLLNYMGDEGDWIPAPKTNELFNFLPVGARLVKREHSYAAKWDALDGATHYKGLGKTPADALGGLVLDLARNDFYKLPSL